MRFSLLASRRPARGVSLLRAGLWVVAVATAPACKQQGRATEAEPACIRCHEGDRKTSTLQDHLADGFPETCDDCHTQQAWKPASLDHRFFPLEGGHSRVACNTCHATEPVPKRCVGCHQDDRSKPTNPNHMVDGFSDTCESCHTIVGWKPAAEVDHSKFPLKGGHSAVACASCHDLGDPPPTTCIGCHADDRKRASDPDHMSAGFPEQCESCHSVTKGWKDAVFDHDQHFPLVGKHSTALCASCHDKDPVPTACYGCHVEDRKKPQNPNHLAAGFSTDCQNCHTATAWTPAAVDHGKFPLTGAHTGAACASCHDKSPVPTTCKGCHDAERSEPRAPQPDHLQEGFSTTCQDCHSTTAWTPSSFDHSPFPLTGGHAGVGCQSCHKTEPVPKTCVGCHDADRKTPTSPNHLASGFSTACQDCHGTAAWKPAAVDHSKFPLTGKHTVVACGSCHDQNPVPTACVGCHDADRSKPTLPNHTQAGFSTQCDSCHTTAGWAGATFDHSSYFPLLGKHSTTTCASCHNQSPVPKVCEGCHLNDRPSGVNPDHLANGFSNKCGDCHVSTGWTPAAFDHSKFPLTGGHSSATCNSCHDKNPVPTTCVGCHAGDVPSGIIPDHKAAGFSTQCSSCHGNSAWKPATFDHSSYWPRNRSAHRDAPCNNCHYDGSDYQKYSCFIGCHKHTETKMADKHKEKNGYSPTACVKCHTKG